MIGPLRNQLLKKNIILASGSPRRIDLLKSIDFPFEVIPSTFEENLKPDDFPNPYSFAIETARRKAVEVFNRLSNQPDLVIGADTIVTFENKVYGKPKNMDDAFEMLTKFSGKTHTVYTGMAFVNETTTKTFYESTEVSMGNLTPDIICEYIKTGEPMDKAGSYGIQGYGGTLIEKIVGDYYNVTGFPLHRFCVELSALFNK